MIKRAVSLLAVMLFGLAVAELAVPGVVIPAAYAAKKKPPGLSKPVFELLQESQELSNAGKWAEALAKAKEAQALPEATDYDKFKINDVLARIYVNTQDYKNAALAYEAAFLSGLSEPEEKPARLKSLVSLFYEIKDHTKALQYAQQYASEVGEDFEVMAITADIYRQQGDSAKAMQMAKDLIAKAELTGTPVKEGWWQLLLISSTMAGDKDTQMRAQMGLVKDFPSKDSWHDLSATIYNLSGRTDHFALLSMRLMRASNSVRRADEYIRLSQLAIQSGLGGEAVSAIKEGEGNGTLPGEMKALLGQVKAEANAAVKGEPGNLDAKDAASAAGKSGSSDVAIGEAFANYGMVDKAVTAINRGLGKTMKTPDEGRLSLGWAYLINGKLPEAKTAFESVQTDANSKKLAAAYLVLVQHKLSPPAPASSPAPGAAPSFAPIN